MRRETAIILSAVIVLAVIGLMALRNTGRTSPNPQIVREGSPTPEESIVQNDESLHPSTGMTDQAGSTANQTTTPGANEISLVVSAPTNNAVVSAPKITVRGSTKARAEVFINEVETTADASGNFSVLYTLEEGDNYIVIVATDADGNVAEQELYVTYETPEE